MEYEIKASPYAYKVFSQMADEVLSYQKEHPLLTFRQCCEILFADMEWVELKRN
jgi:predicted esterase YcpF (UPF0227 family)